MFKFGGAAEVTSYTERSQVPEKLMDGTYVEGLCAFFDNAQAFPMRSFLQVSGRSKMGYGGAATGCYFRILTRAIAFLHLPLGSAQVILHDRLAALLVNCQNRHVLRGKIWVFRYIRLIES